MSEEFHVLTTRNKDKAFNAKKINKKTYEG